ncbi:MULTISPECIES: hypothetical protein [Aerosakkonema]
MNNNSSLHLANWEVDKLAKEPGFLIRPVEPQPQQFKIQNSKFKK